MLNQEKKDLNPENCKWISKPNANKLAAKYGKQIRKQKLSFSFIYSIIIVPPIPKDACGEHT